MNGLVEVERDGRVAVVTLSDPGQRNALTLPMVDDIVEVFDDLEADEGVGAVVVTGAPPAFCAGANLGNLGATGSGSSDQGKG
ncbi:MAG: enoyl-CoA hydratase/isomerase family protein, partial [Actinomycetota bacterium]